MANKNNMHNKITKYLKAMKKFGEKNQKKKMWSRSGGIHVIAL